MNTPLAFVYFDLDDTLLDHRHAERAALADLCGDFGELLGHVPIEEVREVYHRHNSALWRKYSLGEIEKAELKRLRFELMLETLAVSGGADLQALDACYVGHYTRHWKVQEGALEAFNAIADRLPVGALTNGYVEMQYAKLDRFPAIRDRLSRVIVSEEVGHLKPHPAIFAHAAEAAGAEPAAVLYVGDSYHSDVEGALNAGWQAAWLTDEPPQDPDEPFFRFSDWGELPGRVLRLVER